MPHPRVLFASYHCCVDSASGAAVSTIDLLAALAARGWRCGAFTGPQVDNPAAPPVGPMLQKQPGVRTNAGKAGRTTFVVHTAHNPGGFPITIFVPDPSEATHSPTDTEAVTFLAVLDQVLRRFRPDVVLTYGGDPASRGIRAAARRVGARVVFRLHNFAYRTRSAFEGSDSIAVPSVFSRNFHRNVMGLESVVVPPVINPNRVMVDRPDHGKYMTFVNPTPEKGVFLYARLAEILGRDRPDIPLLVVEGRGQVNWLGRCGVDLSAVGSFHRMANTPDPRQFYSVSRVMLVPSVWWESFGRVAVEAMFNGIPVIASDRGALPEAVGSGGTCLAIPEHLTPDARTPLTAAEVTPWVEAVQQLWDDPVEYATASQAARSAALAWDPEAMTQRWEEFFTDQLP